MGGLFGKKEYDDDFVMTGCEKSCHRCGTCQLQIFNLFDFAAGGMLIGFSIYLQDLVGPTDFSSDTLSWMGYSSALLGALLIVLTLFAFTAITTSGCRWAIFPSKVLAILACLLEICLGIACAVKRKEVFDYFNDNDDISDKSKDDVKLWYSIISYAYFVMAVVEMIRIYLSGSFRKNALRIDGEFDALIAKEDREWQEKIAVNQASREEKYNDLRAYYKAKYSKDPPASPAR